MSTQNSYNTSSSKPNKWKTYVKTSRPEA